jgi:maltose O-acetyltransferase
MILSIVKQLIEQCGRESTLLPAGSAMLKTPLRCLGDGYIEFGKGVSLGTIKGPSVLSVSQLIAINGGRILIGNDVIINNNFTILADGVDCVIGDRSVIGGNFQMLTRDGHCIDPSLRAAVDKTMSICIEENCWIGGNVTLLKGSKVGKNSVISNGIVLNRRVLIPEDSLVKQQTNVEVRKILTASVKRPAKGDSVAVCK